MFRKRKYSEIFFALTPLNMAVIVIVWLIFNLLVLKKILKMLAKISVYVKLCFGFGKKNAFPS